MFNLVCIFLHVKYMEKLHPASLPALPNTLQQEKAPEWLLQLAWLTGVRKGEKNLSLHLLSVRREPVPFPWKTD